MQFYTDNQQRGAIPLIIPGNQHWAKAVAAEVWTHSSLPALGNLPMTIHTPLLLSRASSGLQKALWAQRGLAGWAGTTHRHRGQLGPWAWTGSIPGHSWGTGGSGGTPGHCSGFTDVWDRAGESLSPLGNTTVIWEHCRDLGLGNNLESLSPPGNT